MNELQIFSNPDFGEIRTFVEPDGTVLFCGNDTAKALGYAKPENAIPRHCRCTLKRGIPHPQNPGKTIEMNFIPEGDVYRLAASSELPGADKFERWIFDEVLPSIRKHGAYATPTTIESIIANPDFGIQLLYKLKDEQEKRRALETENTQQKQMLAEYSPKASYYDVILQTKDVIAISQISKDYGKSAKWLNEYLHEKGVQYKLGGIWLIYQKCAEMGYTKSKTHSYSGSDGNQHSKIHTYWTQKGRLFIYGLLKKDGILPLMEREQASAAS